MPTPTTTDLPIPKSWDEFEDISADVLIRSWRDPYVVRNGRSGQRQNGVDIYGRPVHLKGQGEQIAGAQCKRVEELTETEIRTEVDAASEFRPKLEEYLLLTTLKRDAKLQTFVRTTTWPIPRVEILFWDDICLRLCESDDLLKKHFPRWFQSSTSKHDLTQFLINSRPDDFDYNDSIGQHLHRRDVAVHLRLNRPENMQPFEEPWVERFSDPRAYQQEVYLEYNGHRIETFYFADVDGGRHLIPYPKAPDDLRISRFQYHLGLILNSKIPGYGLDHALNLAGITVDDAL